MTPWRPSWRSRSSPVDHTCAIVRSRLDPFKQPVLELCLSRAPPISGVLASRALSQNTGIRTNRAQAIIRGPRPQPAGAEPAGHDGLPCPPIWCQMDCGSSGPLACGIGLGWSNILPAGQPGPHNAPGPGYPSESGSPRSDPADSVWPVDHWPLTAGQTKITGQTTVRPTPPILSASAPPRHRDWPRPPARARTDRARWHPPSPAHRYTTM